MSAAYNVAEVYAYRGDKDRAFEWLERARRQRDGGLGFMLCDPFLANLREDPRWSDDKGSEYFSDGISEELLTVLQKIPGLHVAARTSAFSFKGKNATAQEIGQKLGVARSGRRKCA